MWIYLLSIITGIKWTAGTGAILGLICAFFCVMAWGDDRSDLKDWYTKAKHSFTVAVICTVIAVLTPTRYELVDGSATLCKLTTSVCE